MHESSTMRLIGMAAGCVLCAAIGAGCGDDSGKPSKLTAPPGNSLPPAAESAWFRDTTAASGIDVTYTSGEAANRYTLLESLGGGVGLIDFDRDGWLDVILPGGGSFDAEGSAIHGRPTRDRP